MLVALAWSSVLVCLSLAADIRRSVVADARSVDDYNEVSSNFNLTSLSLDDVQNITTIASNSSILTNSTHHGFLHGLGESISVILVSEIGDKTFFIAAILAMRNNKLTVFLAAISALFLMTILSGLLGWVVTTFIPREVTYYTCTAIMFLFGLKMLWEAWKMDDNEADEVQREVEQELARRGSISSVNRQDVERATAEASKKNKEAKDKTPEGEISENTESNNEETINKTKGESNEAFESGDLDEVDLNEEASADAADKKEESSGKPAKEEESKQKSTKPSQTRSVHFLDNVIDRSCKENSWFGKKCLKVFKLFINTFTMTFIAEWGDRSQLATIVLVGINDVGGVIVGGCLGHLICTGGAVLAGAMIAKYVSVRKVTFFGALVFLGFAVASIFISPQEDGIEGIPEIAGYDNGTRLINHNVSLTLALQQMKEEDGDMIGSLYEEEY